jgi:hypothetical protein
MHLHQRVPQWVPQRASCSSQSRCLSQSHSQRSRQWHVVTDLSMVYGGEYPAGTTREGQMMSEDRHGQLAPCQTVESSLRSAHHSHVPFSLMLGARRS